MHCLNATFQRLSIRSVFSTASLQRGQAAVVQHGCGPLTKLPACEESVLQNLSSGIFTLSKDSEGSLPLAAKSIHQGFSTAVKKSWLSSLFFGSLGQNNTSKVSSEK
ncbi:hypothetical protein AOXY_G23985 [Acipenser oxyrinchus oxyrinchus]|uniref:Uncharacterized protein n=1 Tax=Acipenser oxyrinchus oxyrinchus TaxID=40147 RepID=A0AAD8CVG2_ACIOX|nr:hypothetical protein AOXY_G23985 [Acipenser oxyrinchus oxyrinchus]